MPGDDYGYDGSDSEGYVNVHTNKKKQYRKSTNGNSGVNGFTMDYDESESSCCNFFPNILSFLTNITQVFCVGRSNDKVKSS